MRKFFTFIAKFIASICAILFVITAVAAILLTTLGQHVLSSQPYKNAFAQQKLYERLPGILGQVLTTSISYNPCAANPVTCEDASPELQGCFRQALGSERYIALATGKEQPTGTEQTKIKACADQNGVPDVITPGASGGDNGMPPFMKNLSASSWETLIKLALPPKDMQKMVEATLDQVFAYLNGKTDTASLSLVQLKAHLTGPAGTDILTQLLRSEPACTNEELARINAGLASDETLFCNPPDEATLNKLLSHDQKQLNDAAKKIPDEVVIIKPSPAGSPAPGSSPLGADPITALRTVRLYLRLSLLVPLAFLLLVTLFGVRSLKGWMRWWGIPIFFAGMIALGLGLAALPSLNWAWKTFVIARIPPYLPTAIAEIGRELASAVVRNLVMPVILWALVLTLLGLTAWVVSFFMKSRPAESAPVAPPLPPAPAA